MDLNKRGQGLSMTTIVVIILALLVLIVLAIIFLGGTGSVFDRIKNVFTGQSQTSVDLARQQCQTWCDIARSSSDKPTTSYCQAPQKRVDVDRDGINDPEEENVFCINRPSGFTGTNSEVLNVQCDGIPASSCSS